MDKERAQPRMTVASCADLVRSSVVVGHCRAVEEKEEMRALIHNYTVSALTQVDSRSWCRVT